jgi:sphingolipid delta-4 desaturase
MTNDDSGPIDYIVGAKYEPHAKRKEEILKKHPEIKELFGYDPLTKYQVLFWVFAQFFVAYFVRNESWLMLLVVAYCFGGFAGHALYLAIHEISHNLCFESVKYNTLFGIFVNTATVVPHFSMFQKYHMEHHRSQGSLFLDEDLPLPIEGILFRTPLRKTLWLFLQPLFYAIRPLVRRPKPLDLLDVLNIFVCLSSTYLFYSLFGMKYVVYLFLSGVLGGGLHPVSGHFIAEHFVFEPGQETYSYYGNLNKVSFNVGYHNEHHDFPRIPGSLLPKIKEIAPEYYCNLRSYDSWMSVLWNFVNDQSMNPFSRMVRPTTI